jgi:hypothetical protein
MLGLSEEDVEPMSIERWWKDVDRGERQYTALPLCLPKLPRGLAWR